MRTFPATKINKANCLAQTPVARPLGRTAGHGRVAYRVMAAAQAEVGKLISKVEIPAFIPRPDLVEQLLRWAVVDMQESGVANVGCPCKVLLLTCLTVHQLYSFVPLP